MQQLSIYGLSPAKNRCARLLAHCAAMWVGSVLFAGIAWSQETLKPETLKRHMQALGDIEARLDTAAYRRAELGDWATQLTQLSDQGRECVNAAGRSIDKVTQDIAVLGPATEGEPADVSKKRTDLIVEQAILENHRAGCRLLILRSKEVEREIAQRQRLLLARDLSARGPNVIVLLYQNWEVRQEWLRALRRFVVDNSGLDRISGLEGVLFGTTLILAAGVGYWLRFRLRRRLERLRRDTSLISGFSESLQASLARYGARLTAASAAAVYLHLRMGDIVPTPFLLIVAYGAPLYFFAVMVVRTFLAPYSPARPFLNIPSEAGRDLGRRLTVLAALSFAGYLLFSTILAQSLPEAALLLARALFAVILILNLLWVLVLLGRLPMFAGVLWARVGLMLVLCAAFVAELIGYRNLSLLMLRVAIGTLAGFSVFLLADLLLREFFAGLARGGRPVHQRLRKLLGLKRGEPVPGLVWIRLTGRLLLWGGFALLLLRIWGVPDATLLRITGYLTEGFRVGSLVVVPVRILLAIGAFALFYVGSGWFKAQLERKWLPRAQMERGTREAVATMSGYVGIAFAALIALGIAGLKFTNLAIIAGALGVGIGFGLQNIVNNFVSGLILLFERPIKTGDWIVVGSTEGHVKRIRIRSTQIQTFDRADVIVPNSELISGQVTNWMLHDPRGRIRVSVGVAYGSDTQKVKEILLSVAAEHPAVIKDDPGWAPTVLFQGFGESSLDFELRCYIANIDDRLGVTSDLNFAIDAAFRAQGVEIPFPQRDLHLRDVSKAAGDTLRKGDNGT